MIFISFNWVRLVGWLVGGTMNWIGTEKMPESQVNVDRECNDHHAPVTPTSALCIQDQWSCLLWHIMHFPEIVRDHSGSHTPLHHMHNQAYTTILGHV